MLIKTLSLLQPWAWIVVNWKGSPHIPTKRIENRKTLKHIRGVYLIHSGSGFDNEGYAWIERYIVNNHAIPQREKDRFLDILKIANMSRGGIVGKMDIVGLGTAYDFWAMPGHNYLKLENVIPLPFFACPGRSSVFETDYPNGQSFGLK